MIADATASRERSWPPRPTWSGDFYRLEATLFACDRSGPEHEASRYAESFVPSPPLRGARRRVCVPEFPVAGIDLPT